MEKCAPGFLICFRATTIHFHINKSCCLNTRHLIITILLSRGNKFVISPSTVNFHRLRPHFNVDNFINGLKPDPSRKTFPFSLTSGHSLIIFIRYIIRTSLLLVRFEWAALIRRNERKTKDVNFPYSNVN